MRAGQQWQWQQGRSFSISARRTGNEKKKDQEQPDSSSTTIHLQPPEPPRDEERATRSPKEQPEPPTPEPIVIQQPPPPESGHPPSPPPPPQDNTDNTPPPNNSPPIDEPLSTPATRLSSLPSAIEQQRWHLSRRFSTLMDSLLTKATLASQQINTYTGTDFSGIEALRTEIGTQENAVKAGHIAVSAQKDRHMEAHVKQASSQKEIVSLLERKSSWSPSDLERYMTLVRSEHLDEQAVQKAKEDLAAAERDLEDARALLERLERKQYHEEQIWSDTIRRNSTWVTIGLMGVNIFLLLAQIIFFEPYRRRKIVREMKEALDERSVVGAPVVAGQAVAPVAAPAAAVAAPEVERQVDEVVEPKAVPTEEVEEQSKAAEEEVQPLDSIVPETATEKVADASPPVMVDEVLPAIEEPSPRSLWDQLQQASSWEDRLSISRAAFDDLFSDRLVHLKKVDVTTVTLQGAASGVAAMGVLFLLLRPN